MIGTDHTSASVNVRSIFTFRKNEIQEAMSWLKINLQANGVLLLATCNRMELWVDMDDNHPDLLEYLCRFKQVNPEDYRSGFVSREDKAAIEHLFYLTCGLRSAILAEDQILTQVKDALTAARMGYFTSSTLEVLFRTAISAAKKVKTKVAFTHADATAIGQAVRMLEAKGFSLEGKTCMVIGNGEYGRLAAETLRRRGADVTVTVRQYHSGMVLIPDGCKQIHYGEKMDLFPHCDLVVSATTSPNYTIYYDKVSLCKPDHPMVLIDFAVPGGSEPEIANLPGYTLYDIDDFRTEEGEQNRVALMQASAILEEKMAEFDSWQNTKDLFPRIDTIREQGGRDVSLRLTKPLKKLPLTAEELENLHGDIENASGKVITKLMYLLRDSLDEESFRKCVEALEKAYTEEMPEEAP
ncbi:MAG: glutamyl-tRNA reductase [Oscillospiraceae bacterium]|nr:glutamyl-tRNA reductase [Oscillospiraceae bacterium]